ncbi:MAG: hypothetical protein KF687_14575 [Cyclobacteriaceae bacterium]|nr:hypothetical protein [Cyclobacteriaceae bacterium]
MIKMNFDNKDEHEDKQLIQLLREEIKEFPSDHLVESTLAKISAMQMEKRFAHKPLRIPIYIMTAIALLLLIPLFVPIAPNSSSLNLLSEFLDYPESSILNYAVWCWFTVVVLWILGLQLQAQSKFYLNPFKL